MSIRSTHVPGQYIKALCALLLISKSTLRALRISERPRTLLITGEWRAVAHFQDVGRIISVTKGSDGAARYSRNLLGSYAHGHACLNGCSSDLAASGTRAALSDHCGECHCHLFASHDTHRALQGTAEPPGSAGSASRSARLGVARLSPPGSATLG